MTDPLPAVHSFYVNAPELDEQRAMAAALGYAVTEAPVLPQVYVTWRKLDRVTGTAPAVGDLWVDASEHNYPMDFAAFKAAGVKRVYLRATLGRHGVDRRWVENRNGVLAAGLELGAYHYFIWNEDGTAQAENFKRVTLDFCSAGPVADAERRRNKNGGVDAQGNIIWLPEDVDRAVASANFLALMRGLALPDSEPAGIYTSKNEWEAMFSLSAADVAPWWKWVAHYRNGAARWNLAVDRPDVPAGWWARVWQYRVAEAGELAWHPRALDLNRYMGETGPAVPPPPPPPPAVLFRVKIITAVLNVRSGPGTGYADIGDVLRDAVLPVFEERGGWYRTHATDPEWISGNPAYSVRV